MVERFQWFLAPGLLLLLISFWAEFPVRPSERTLPLARAKAPAARSAAMQAATLLVTAGLMTFFLPRRAVAAEEPSETIAKPLTTTVARLAGKDALSPEDYSDLAATTVTFGQRVKAAKQQLPENVVRDALQAVDEGESAAPKAADWPKFRRDLQDLMKKDEPPPEQKKDDQKKNQDQKDQQKQDQNQSPDQQKQDQGKSDQQKQDQPKPEQQNQSQKNNQDAFGDMKDQPENKADPKAAPPPKPGTQKVGGQQDKKPTEAMDPALTLPLQKLDQVRNQDSPAKLQQIMQGQQQKTKVNGKDW
jgi:Ca-activated chloride channel family protein